jgi:hypothetical protein
MNVVFVNRRSFSHRTIISRDSASIVPQLYNRKLSQGKRTKNSLDSERAFIHDVSPFIRRAAAPKAPTTPQSVAALDNHRIPDGRMHRSVIKMNHAPVSWHLEPRLACYNSGLISSASPT